MRPIEELTAPEKTTTTRAAKSPTKTNAKPKTRSQAAASVAETLPMPIARKLHDLEQTARACDETVDQAKQTLKEAKEEADAAHRALLDYVRTLTDPDFQPLFKGLDQEPGEGVHTGEATTGAGGTAHATAH